MNAALLIADGGLNHQFGRVGNGEISVLISMHNEDCGAGAFPFEAIHNRHKAELIKNKLRRGK